MAAGTKPDLLRKSPSTSRNYYVDFGAWAELNINGDTIASASTVTVSPSGPTIGSPVISGTKIVFNIAGGSAGNTYTLTVTCTTSSGAVLSCKPILVVENI